MLGLYLTKTGKYKEVLMVNIVKPINDRSKLTLLLTDHTQNQFIYFVCAYWPFSAIAVPTLVASVVHFKVIFYNNMLILRG